eukprot:CFRG7927T1
MIDYEGTLPPHKRYIKRRTSEMIQLPTDTRTYTYEMINYLNKGSSAQVYLAERTPNNVPAHMQITERVAVKQIEKTSKNYRLTRNEVQIHSSVSHMNVVGFKQYFETSRNFVCVQELMRCDLFDMITTSKEECSTDDDILMILSDILKGLSHLHSQNIAHRDVKLENVGLTYEQVPKCTNNKQIRSIAKLMDLGLSIRLREGMLINQGIPGTVEYAAPELVQFAEQLDLSFEQESDPSGHPFVKADMWAVGILLYLLVSTSTGCRFPWARAHSSDVAFAEFLSGETNWYESLKNSNPIFLSLFNGLLSTNPSKRLNAKEALNMVEKHLIRTTPRPRRTEYNTAITALLDLCASTDTFRLDSILSSTSTRATGTSISTASDDGYSTEPGTPSSLVNCHNNSPSKKRDFTFSNEDLVEGVAVTPPCTKKRKLRVQ